MGKIAEAVCGELGAPGGWMGGPDAVLVSQEGINTPRYDEANVRAWMTSDLVEG